MVTYYVAFIKVLEVFSNWGDALPPEQPSCSCNQDLVWTVRQADAEGFFAADAARANGAVRNVCRKASAFLCGSDFISREAIIAIGW